MPRWRLIVLLVGAAGAILTVAALVDVAVAGVSRPLVAAVGIGVTAAVNSVYVVIARRGDVLEGIDVAEAPLVALALLLPPMEALLVFTLGSLLLEVSLERATVKKVLNVGVRVVGAALMLVPVWVVSGRTDGIVATFAAAAAGAALYTAFTVLTVAVVVSAVLEQPVRDHLRENLRSRLLVWAVAVAMGLSAGYVVSRSPVVLAGLLAPLALFARMATVTRDSQREAERMRHVVDAISQIQSAATTPEQEAALLAAARDLLLWRDVSIRDVPPGDGEHGAPVTGDGTRWLVASPLPDSDPWSDEDEKVVTVLAARAATAFDRAALQARLSEQALLDPLTHLANRRQFEAALHELCSADDPQFAVLVLDLDGFKSVNDRFGHAAGDELLRVASQRLVSTVRSGDVVARIGGDEFIVLLRGIESPGVAERISRNVAAKFAEPVKILRWQLGQLPVSIGIAVAPYDGVDGRELVRVADEAMYEAKRARLANAGGNDALMLPVQAASERRDPAATDV